MSLKLSTDSPQADAYTAATMQLASIKIVSEGSVSSSVRRLNHHRRLPD